MRFDIISLFPEFVANLAAHGVVGRAGERGLIDSTAGIHATMPRAITGAWMIPFVQPQYVQAVDFEAGLIRVDWDADF